MKRRGSEASPGEIYEQDWGGWVEAAVDEAELAAAAGTGERQQRP